MDWPDFTSPHTDPAALGLVLGVPAAQAAPPVDYSEIPLSQAELDANWGTDRATPSGGFESVTFDGRSDVLEVRIAKDNRSTGSAFYYTEGLVREVDAVDASKIDLYVDPDWEAEAGCPSSPEGGRPARCGTSLDELATRAAIESLDSCPDAPPRSMLMT